jgi:hypothetical protein
VTSKLGDFGGDEGAHHARLDLWKVQNLLFML